MITAHFGADSASAKFFAHQDAIPYPPEELDTALTLACTQTLLGPPPAVCVYPADKLTAKELKKITGAVDASGNLRLAYTTKTLPAAVKKASEVTQSEHSFPKPAAAKQWIAQTAADLYDIPDLAPEVVTSLQPLLASHPDFIHKAFTLLKSFDPALRPRWKEYLTLPQAQPPIWQAIDAYTAGDVRQLAKHVTEDTAYQIMSMVGSRTALLLLAATAGNYDPTSHGVTSNAWASAQRTARKHQVDTWKEVHRITMRAALDLRTSGITPTAAAARLLLAGVEVQAGLRRATCLGA